MDIKQIKNIDEYYKQKSWCKEVNKKFIFSTSYDRNINESKIDITQATIVLSRMKDYEKEMAKVGDMGFKYETILKDMFILEDPEADDENISYLKFSILQNNETKDFEIIYYVADVFTDIKEIEKSICGLCECQIKLYNTYLKQL